MLLQNGGVQIKMSNRFFIGHSASSLLKATSFCLVLCIGFAGAAVFSKSAPIEKRSATVLPAVSEISYVPTDTHDLESRPIFSPNRVSTKRNENSLAGSSSLKLKATGITDSVKTAIFEVPQGSLVIREGQKSKGISVLEVSELSVLIERDGVRKLLRLNN